MPVYAAQQRGPRSGRRRSSSPGDDDGGRAAPPAELSLQQQLGLVKGVPLSPASEGAGSPTPYDAARAAMCLLKEEDHVWTIDTCMETINLLRARNNSLKEKLMEVDINFVDHVEARQRKIKELTLESKGAAAIREQLEATLEAERGDRRRQERDHQRQRDAETLTYETKIKHLTEDLESLQQYSGERQKIDDKLAKLEAANAELVNKHETREQTWRLKVAKLEAEKEGDVTRLVLEAKQNMRDEVEIAFSQEFQQLVKDNQVMKDKLKQLDSKMKIVLSELEHETMAKDGLKKELNMLRTMESKSAGKIKYYMKMLKRSAHELAQQCESGDGERSAPSHEVSAGVGVVPGVNRVRTCHSCGIETSVAGERGDSVRRTISNATRRPGTAPVKIRCRGDGSDGGDGGGNQEGSDNGVADAREESAANNGCCVNLSRGRGSNHPVRSPGKPIPKRTRAQTAAGPRTIKYHCGGGCDGAGVNNPRRRAQTAGRSRDRFTVATRYRDCSYPLTVTLPSHPRVFSKCGKDPSATRGSIGVANTEVVSRTDLEGEMEVDVEKDVDQNRRQRGKVESNAIYADSGGKASGGDAHCSRRPQIGEQDREGLLATRNSPPTWSDHSKRPSRGVTVVESSGDRQPVSGGSSEAAAAAERVMSSERTKDVSSSRRNEGGGKKIITMTSPDKVAVQCWRELDAYLKYRGDNAARPTRPATCGSINPGRPPAMRHQAIFSRQHHRDTGTKLRTNFFHGGQSGAKRFVDPGHSARHGGDGDVGTTRIGRSHDSRAIGCRRPWTAIPHVGRSGGGGDGGGEQKWWERLGGGGGVERSNGACCKVGQEDRGGKLWGDRNEIREHELFTTLKVGEVGNTVPRSGTEEELDFLARHAIESATHHRHGATADATATAATAVEIDSDAERVGEEERLLRAIDNGDPELLSPGSKQHHHHQRQGYPSSRAARTMTAALETAQGSIRNRLPANKPRPQQTVLVRERLGGVGTGAPTAPRPSEIDAVAAEEAAKAAATAAAISSAASQRTVQPETSTTKAEALVNEETMVVEEPRQESASVEVAEGDHSADGISSGHRSSSLSPDEGLRLDGPVVDIGALAASSCSEESSEVQSF